MNRALTLLLAAMFYCGLNRALAEDLKFQELAFRPGLAQFLNAEFGTSTFPPLTDYRGHYYRVAGTGPQAVTFRFQSDNGAFTPDFGFYRVSPELAAIDTSGDAGKIAYAKLALAPGNAELVFSNYREGPPKIKTPTLSGGELIGFFSIPHFPHPMLPYRTWLEVFQAHPEQFALDGRDPNNEEAGNLVPGRWPFFSYTPANPGGFDQMFSLHGSSIASGKQSSLLLWEDASLLVDSGFPIDGIVYDGDFNDEIYVVEGVIPIPEPHAMFLLLVAGAGVAAGFRRRAKAAIRPAGAAPSPPASDRSPE